MENLFNYATKELSQDAFLMWLMANYNCEEDKQLKDVYGSIVNIYNTKIPRAVKIAESTSYGESIFSYDKNNKVAEAYSSLSKEVLIHGKEKTRNENAKNYAR